MSHVPHRMVQVEQNWVDRCATWFADRCSPILVKESRQAMKSWQFQWTFLLLLLAVVGWSFMAVSVSLNTGLDEAGGMLLAGYLCILGFPLGVVLPLSAFRSMAREFDEDTIQLISITTMSARRIVLGKLGSAVLQLVVYLAAVVPCTAFSYILRGTDLTQILYLLTLCIVGSLSLTCVGLMLAGFAKFNWMAILLNLVLIFTTMMIFFGWCSFVGTVGAFGIPEEGRTAIWMFAGFLASTGYLAFECAVSLVSFPSENRSTPIRVALSTQLLLLLGFSTGMFAALEFSPVLERFYPFVSIIGSHYLAFIGLMLVSEQPGLSQRVRRSLPTTVLGRILWGIYLPGPGRGYLFALSAILFWNAALGLTCSLGWHQWFSLNSDPTKEMDVWIVLGINVAFATLYVSLVYMFMLCFGKWIPYGRIIAGMLLGLVAYFIVAIACTSIDAFIYMGDYRYRYDYLGAAQHFNWPIIVGHAADENAASHVEITIALCVGAAIAALTCLYFATKELVAVPLLAPQRVQAETLKRKYAAANSNPLAETLDNPEDVAKD